MLWETFGTYCIHKQQWSTEASLRYTCQSTCADPEGGQGVRLPPPPPPPGKLQKNIGFLSNTGPNPLKITKLPIQHSMLGHHRPASETPFKWCFTGRPVDGTLIVVFGSSILIKLKKNPKKHQSWTPSDKTC